MNKVRNTRSLHSLANDDEGVLKNQKRKTVVNDNVYLMAKQFHRKDIRFSHKSSLSSFKEFTSDYVNESSMFPITSQARPSRNLSQSHISTQKMQSRQSKALSESIGMFQNNLVNQHENDESVVQLKTATICGMNLTELLERLAYNLKCLIQSKNEKMAQIVIEKLCEYQMRFKEIKQLLLDNARPRDWSAELFFKRIVVSQTKIYKKKLVFKDHRMDSSILTNILEFNQRVEETTIKKCDEMYRQLSINIREQEQQLRSKELEFIKLLQYKKEQNPSVKVFVPSRVTSNLRLLLNGNAEVLQEYEERHGQFNHVKNITRFMSLRLNKVVQELSYQHL